MRSVHFIMMYYPFHSSQEVQQSGTLQTSSLDFPKASCRFMLSVSAAQAAERVSRLPWFPRKLQTACGMVPVRELVPPKFKLTSHSSSPISLGNSPVNELKSSRISRNMEHTPNSEGIFPVNRLPSRCNVAREDIRAMEGRLPVKAFKLSTRFSRLLMAFKMVGSDPPKSLLFKNSSFRFRNSWNSQGMEPPWRLFQLKSKYSSLKSWPISEGKVPSILFSSSSIFVSTESFPNSVGNAPLR